MRGDQYAIALGLLDEGKVVLGVLACPNLPLATISSDYQRSADEEVGCLFFAEVGAGTYMQPLSGSSPVKVSSFTLSLYVICIKQQMVLTDFIAFQVHVTSIGNSEEASFFESYEKAHSMHDLSYSIAQVLLLSSVSILFLPDYFCCF